MFLLLALATPVYGFAVVASLLVHYFTIGCAYIICWFRLVYSFNHGVEQEVLRPVSGWHGRVLPRRVLVQRRKLPTVFMNHSTQAILTLPRLV